MTTADKINARIEKLNDEINRLNRCIEHYKDVIEYEVGCCANEGTAKFIIASAEKMRDCFESIDRIKSEISMLEALLED